MWMSRVTGNPLAYLTAKCSSAAAWRGSRTFTGARQNLYLHAGETGHPSLFLSRQNLGLRPVETGA